MDVFDVDGVPTVFLFSEGDGKEIEYPKYPNPISGYSEDYLVDYLESFSLNGW